MRFLFIVVILFPFLLFTCNPKENKSVREIGFYNPDIQQILKLKDERKSAELFVFFKSSNSSIRSTSALAFASIQDTNSIPGLCELLNDSDPEVKINSCFALGQIRHLSAESHLIRSYQKETSVKVKHHISEAIGKCGSMKGLDFLTGFSPLNTDTFLITGQAWGIYRFALRKIVSEKGTELMVKYLQDMYNDDLRFIASGYLARSQNIDIVNYQTQIFNSINADPNGFVRMNLATSLSKLINTATKNILIGLLKTENDYRVMVNIIRTLSKFPYDSVAKSLFAQLYNPNPHIGYTASQFFRDNGMKKDISLYNEAIAGDLNFRTQANLMATVLKYLDPLKHKKIRINIKKQIENKIANTTLSIYYRALLINALSEDFESYPIIAEITFSTKEYVLKTYGIEGLINERKNVIFSSVKDSLKYANDFKTYFIKAIESGDVSLIGTAAGILRDPRFNYKTILSDFTFIENAIIKLQLPKDMETLIELQKTLGYFQNTTQSTPPTPFNNPIDLTFVSQISDTQKVRIETSKGEIIIHLFKNDAPGSVANFIRLIKEGFYKNNVFHRVVPNFVIQSGCPRGDGWGGPEHSIRSEFYPRHYGEGYVGMASAGKDTEGSQWFITHSPAPHLDGNYTIFGKVISGMDVVHRIEIGDRVEKMILE